MPRPVSRVVLLVIDGLGVGALPDAHRYGSTGANTLSNTARAAPLTAPVLARLGLGRVEPACGLGTGAVGAYGRMCERSAGTDSMTGHWELTGIITERPFQTYPQGFDPAFIEDFRAATGRPVLGNEVASGTEILERLGSRAHELGAPIVYTSADSVLQVAAHEDVGVETLYAWCEQARRILGASVARVIARPYRGSQGTYQRISESRRDFTLPVPPGGALDILARENVPVVALGKVADLFAGVRFAATSKASSDAELVGLVRECLSRGDEGLIFANAGDLDSVYGHRNDPEGWSRAFSLLDQGVGTILDALRDDDVTIVTGDHGNDPTTPSTDHEREYVPVLAVTGRAWREGTAGRDLGVRETFADVGATICELLTGRTGGALGGTSFAAQISAHTGLA